MKPQYAARLTLRATKMLRDRRMRRQGSRGSRNRRAVEAAS